MVGAVIGGALSAAGGIGSSLLGGKKAAGGSQQSEYLQALEMNQNIVNTQPFIGAGQYGVNALQAGLQSGQFGTPMDLSGMPTAAQVPQYTGGPPPQFSWDPTMEGLAATPGFRFADYWGRLAAQSSAAARGLGMSGAAMRGALDYSSGLASKTYDQQLTNAINIYGQNLAGYNAGLNQYDRQLAGYQAQGTQFQNQFNDYWGNQNNQYKNFYDLAALGANSAAGQATSGTTAASNIGDAAQKAGAIQGASIQGAGNALTGAINSPAFQNLLTGGGKNANNQSVTGGGIFNSFSGAPSYFSGSGNYYNPGAGYSPSSFDPTFAPGAAPATQYYNPIGFAQS